MSHSPARWLVGAAVAAVLGAAAHAAAPLDSRAAPAIERLKAEVSGADVRISSATGTARFVRVAPAISLDLGAPAPQVARQAEAALGAAAASFLDRHGAAFGLRGGSRDLELRRAETDEYGQTHLTYAQRYRSLPVLGAEIKVHFDASGRMTVVNGTAIPDIDVNATPSVSLGAAQRNAAGFVRRKGASAQDSRLLIFRQGLTNAVPGKNYLAYEVVVTDGRVRDFVYVDAHTGKVIEKISGTPDALHRRAYDAGGATAPGPTYPAAPFWEEGDPFPTPDPEANNMIQVSGETYALFWNAFRRDSYDGAGAVMDSIFNRGNACPNASWNGTFISFCPGLTTDDVTGHEWGHAYTEYTDALIYAWQSGALNEAASDVFGEVVDRLNTHDAVPGNGPRAAGVCSVHSPLQPSLAINSPPSIAGDKTTAGATFGAQVFDITNDVVLANDGVGVGTDGCEVPFANAGDIAGKIALIDRGTCGFSVKVKNAEDNGAIAVIIGNNQGGTIATPMGPTAGFSPTIPSLMATQNDTAAMKAELASTVVNATMVGGAFGTDPSARWLMGEDSTATGLEGALRDMWEPNCYVNPNRVSDPMYHCASSDNGGVHINSGVDNRAFSLLVDGGTHNGVSVGAIGMTKATHIWYRAKVAYQFPATTFADHADALEQSCDDLIGKNLRSLTTGTLSGQKITSGNCRQVKRAMQAVEMRLAPVQCGARPPLLAQDPPAVCPPSDRSPRNVFSDNFERPARSANLWTASVGGTTPDFTERGWTIIRNAPERKGRVYFGPHSVHGTCLPGGDETAVLHLDSKAFEVPPGNAPRLSFDHWLSTEPGWDGSNVKISVNGGPFQLVPASAFIYNAYNFSLFTAGQGNSNPLAGQQAFTAADTGDTNSTWGKSIIDLTGIAAAGDIVRLRFDTGEDGCNGWVGWYIDNVKVQQCR
jgi:Zn-dependent metalloprotease